TTRKGRAGEGGLVLERVEGGGWRVEGLELGTWNLERGAWNLELGAWSLELVAWSLELGTSSSSLLLRYNSSITASFLKFVPMSAVYENFGVSFMYPENWQLADESGDAEAGPKTVSVNSPGGGFWALHVYEPAVDPQDLADQ